MKRIVRLFLLIALCSVIFMGCSSINPFSVPDEQIVVDSEESTKEYMESVEKDIEKNDQVAEESAEAFSKTFDENTESIYNNAVDKYVTPSADGEKESLSTILLKGFYKTYHSIRLAAPIISIVSVIIGVLGMIFARNNKGIQRFCLTAFVIAVPVLMLIVIFGVGYLNGLYLHN